MEAKETKDVICMELARTRKRLENDLYNLQQSTIKGIEDAKGQVDQVRKAASLKHHFEIDFGKTAAVIVGIGAILGYRSASKSRFALSEHHRDSIVGGMRSTVPMVERISGDRPRSSLRSGLVTSVMTMVVRSLLENRLRK